MPLRLSTSDPGFEEAFRKLLAMKREVSEDVDAAAASIIEDVRRRGDAAVIEYTKRWDRLELSPATMRVDLAETPPCPQDEIEALQLAATRIEAYHRAQLPQRRPAAAICRGRNSRRRGR